MNIFDLEAKIGLDSKGFERGISAARKKISTFAKVGVGALVAGSAAIAGGLVKATKATADYGDKVDKMSQKIGISAESYQKWDYVMQRAGGSVDSLKMGMKTLSKQAESNSDAFQKLGISQEEVSKSSQEELFNKTIKGLAKMKAGTERAALASQLLGRAGADLGPLLNQGSDAIEEQMEIAEKYGMVMPDAAVKASAAFKDSLTTLQMTFQGLRNRLMAEFLPSLTQVTDGLAKVFTGDMSGVKDIEKGVNGVIDNVKKALPKIAEIGNSILTPLLNAILKGIPKMMPTIIDIGVKIISAILKGLIQSAPLLIDGLFQIIKSTIKTLKEVDWSELGKNFIDQLKKVFTESPAALAAVLTVAGLKLGKALLGGFGSALSGSQGISGVFGKVLGGGAGETGGGFLGDPAKTAKGLASFGIIIGGVTAIVEAFGALNKIPGIKEFTKGGGQLLKEVFSAIGQIATPQTLGIFAAIEGMGMLGVGTAASGLASVATLIGGITLIVEAFGALDKIPGIEKFTQGGGNLLALVMEQIGRAVGAVAKGFAVEVTAALPEIGANLAGFAKSAQPFFDMAANADFSGMQGFADGLMALVKADLGNKLSEFLFGSGYNFEQIGQELAKFSKAMIDYFKNASQAGDTSKGIELMRASSEISTLVSATKEWEAGWGEADLAGLGKNLSEYATNIMPFFQRAAEIGDTSKGVELMSVSGKIKSLVKAAEMSENIGTLSFTQLASSLTEYAGKMKEYFNTSSQIGDMSKGLAIAEKSSAFNKLVNTAKDYSAGSLATLGQDLAKFSITFKTFSENMSGSGDLDVSPAIDQVNKLTTSFAEKSGSLHDAISSMGSGVSSAFTGIKNAVSSGANSIAQAADFSGKIKSSLSKVSSAISSSSGSIKSSLQSIENAFKSSANRIGSAANFSSKVKAGLNAVNSAVVSAKGTIQTNLNALSRAFSNTRFSFQQHIAVPHFSMSGNFDAKTKSVPTVSTSWYGKAMDQPYVFSEPTFFGAGERGDEVLFGRNKLLKDMEKAVQNAGGNVIINLNYDASTDANEMLRDIARGMRRYKMAGVL